MAYRLTFLAILLCYCGAAAAHGPLRCKGKIIDTGATVAEVLALCGSPETRIVQEVPIRAGVASGFSRLIGLTTTEQWIYDRGWGRFPAVLTIDNGKIQRIDYLPYRSGDE